MAAETGPSPSGVGRLPIELRAALDLVVLRVGDPDGAPRGVASGAPRLVEELRRYGWIEANPGTELFPRVVLGASPAESRTLLDTERPHRVIALQAGPIASLLAPLRRGGGDVTPGLPRSAWRALGYAPAWEVGVFGPASLLWAAAERLLRRAGRPDLADRCRLGMLRMLATSGPGRGLAMVSVRAYQKATP